MAVWLPITGAGPCLCHHYFTFKKIKYDICIKIINGAAIQHIAAIVNTACKIQHWRFLTRKPYRR